MKYKYFTWKRSWPIHNELYQTEDCNKSPFTISKILTRYLPNTKPLRQLSYVIGCVILGLDS